MKSDKDKHKSSKAAGPTKKVGRNKPSLGEAFEKLLDSKWFEGGKAITELKDKLEEMALIVPTSRLPVYLLKAVRSQPQRLTRNKIEINGKKVWVYSPK